MQCTLFFANLCPDTFANIQLLAVLVAVVMLLLLLVFRLGYDNLSAWLK